MRKKYIYQILPFKTHNYQLYTLQYNINEFLRLQIKLSTEKCFPTLANAYRTLQISSSIDIKQANTATTSKPSE